MLPTPKYHRHLAVGRDYFGPDLMGLAEYKTLEAQLNDKYPNRFQDPLTRKHAQFASTFIFSFLEAAIARCAFSEDFEAGSSGVIESITELINVLDASSQEIICVRSVTHLTTVDGNELEIGGIKIIPESARYDDSAEHVCGEIPGAPSAWNRELPWRFDPPHALLVTRESVEDPGDFYGAGRLLSARLERFLRTIRILTSGTVQTAFEITGPSTLTSPMSPHLHEFGKTTLMGRALVRREVKLTGNEAQAIEAIGKIIDSAEVKRDRIVATSFDVAMKKFNAAHVQGSLFDQLVDLATALEAALIGENEGEGLTLRLCSRAAALLSQTDDSSTAIFNDVKQLYLIRSKLVHGGQISEKDLGNLFKKLSTMPQHGIEGHFGIALAHAVDRMSDLVRRAILARLCLAEGPQPKWPFAGGVAVDAQLSDDDQRRTWRKLWHDRLIALGVGESAKRARAAVDMLIPEEESQTR
ncbi:hypothetical protein [Pseudarthrobacter sp. NPDC080039]|uniref:hypothetical protein n=1 Tax=Pseudarthrobacter sp. NPDC080039 TaxID=3155290 RepID=UPI00344DB4ED